MAIHTIAAKQRAHPRRRHTAVRARLEVTPLASLVRSSIVLGELEFGAEKSVHSERNRERLAELAARIPLATVDAEVSRC